MEAVFWGVLALALNPSPALDDRVLARRIRDGSHEAFRRFFERYHQHVYQYLLRRKVPGDVAEDIMQRAFVRIWERRAEIDESKSLRSFLFTICHNRALNHFRDTAKFDRAQDPAEAAGTTQGAPQAEYNLVRETLQKAVEALPERRRAVFELCFLQELSYREAAEVLGISIKTVENQMSQALKSIRARMEAYR